MGVIIESKSKKETQGIATMLAEEIVKNSSSKTIVLALQGELGAGKTVFTQGFASSLGVKEKITSPTFILMKVYPLKLKKFKHLIHIDCYRLKHARDVSCLGIKNIFEDRDAIVVVEWADRIKKLIPRNAIWIKFEHGEKNHERIINFQFSNGLKIG